MYFHTHKASILRTVFICIIAPLGLGCEQSVKHMTAAEIEAETAILGHGYIASEHLQSARCDDTHCSLQLNAPSQGAEQDLNRLGFFVRLKGVEASPIKHQGLQIVTPGREVSGIEVVHTGQLYTIWRSDFDRAQAGQYQLQIPKEMAETIDSIDYEWLHVSRAQVLETSEPSGISVVAQQPVPKAIGLSGVTTRAEWGARARSCESTDTVKYRMAIHHTATPFRVGGDIAENVRGIQRFHMDVRQWCDIGYHLIIGDDGSVYQGRTLDQRGAHVGGHNEGNIGLSMLGCFSPEESDCQSPRYTDDTVPTQETLDTLTDLMADLSKLYLIDIDATTVRGHRDYPDQLPRACPGSEVVPLLAGLRSEAINKANNVVVTGDGTLQGIVFDNSIVSSAEEATVDSGARLGDARILLGNGTILRTDVATGAFETELFPGLYYLTVSYPGFRTETVQAQVQAEQIEVANIGLTPLPEGEQFAHLNFLVFDGNATEQVIQDAQIELMPVGRPDLLQVLYTDDMGRKEVDIQAGDWVLTVSAGGFAETSQTYFFEGRTYDVDVGLVDEGEDEGYHPDFELEGQDDGLDYEDVIRIEEVEGCLQSSSSVSGFAMYVGLWPWLSLRRRRRTTAPH